jgi:hypothetical protein
MAPSDEARLMPLLVARLLIVLALICSPFVLVVLASRKPESAILLIFPVVGGTPVILGALLVFAPLEAYLNARGLGHLKNVAVPLAGAVLIVILTFAGLWAMGDLPKSLAGMSSAPISTIGAIGLVGVVGAICGALWRLSAWVAAKVGLAGAA